MSKGFVKLWRQIDDSAISKYSPLHYRVWGWLLTHAAHKSTTVDGIDLEAGELATTYRRIAESITWEENRSLVTPSLQQMRTVMGTLERLGMVKIERRTSTGTATGPATGLRAELQQGYLHMKVLHWEDYQGQLTTTATGLSEELQQGLQQGQQHYIKEVRKKEPKTLVVSDDEQAVFDRWKEAIGANGRTKLDPPRLKSIRWAIDNYGMDGAMEALQGLANDSWSQEGPFSRREIAMVFRDAPHIERYMNKSVEPTVEKINWNEEIAKWGRGEPSKYNPERPMA